MRTLIDGYNVMFAGGLMGQKFGPDGFRKARTRFLNDVAAALNPIEAQFTTIVFDASQPPPDRPAAARHKGMSILFAVDVESADERIEILIAAHSSPKTLTVVSSDHRVQRAATRRRAKVMSADDYWSHMDRRKLRKPAPTPSEPVANRDERPVVSSASEAAFWMAEFGELAESDEIREVSRGDVAFPTDEELARIAREVAAEDPVLRHRSR